MFGAAQGRPVNNRRLTRDGEVLAACREAGNGLSLVFSGGLLLRFSSEAAGPDRVPPGRQGGFQRVKFGGHASSGNA